MALETEYSVIDEVKKTRTRSSIWIPVVLFDRMENLKLIKQEPWYSVIIRALDSLEREIATENRKTKKL